ncbi:conserved hypothetical protein [Burkholderia mallei PRL-20]|uniref:Uncharacterized protein n=1 Tax=Burkholderia mallei (strain NCTC 10229) TaxID=412022 RepID=A2S036_BURM9|nr:hypothetical protein BMASAVP1_1221 [Burkholderia mallei SAVP1]ABM98685.2 hypothetical protein BMA10229_1503 [Burkholderia mallei NCTC 10229]ABO02670.1 hypothetical protein BMA10247_A0077 [Burkholderia mallei NCTC 10247]EEP86622.1 conserved hypothetical protein [Burkholderia mallei GB8 horse 4]EES47065.1 conserved hypothetical protein [Burkholderia mallei PRL-20]
MPSLTNSPMACVAAMSGRPACARSRMKTVRHTAKLGMGIIAGANSKVV